MGWDNPPVPWRELERRLSWRTPARPQAGGGQAEEPRTHPPDGRPEPWPHPPDGRPEPRTHPPDGRPEPRPHPPGGRSESRPHPPGGGQAREPRPRPVTRLPGGRD